MYKDCNDTGCKHVIDIKCKVEILEKKVAIHETNINNIATTQAESRVYLSEIKQQIDRLESRLFAFMDNLVSKLTTSNNEETKQAVLERTDNTEKWLAFSKWVIGGTIFVIVAYFFVKEVANK